MVDPSEHPLDEPPGPETAPFAARYSIVKGADVYTWTEDEAHMDSALYRGLRDKFGGPVIGYVGGLHYQFKPSTSVPADTCAVPRESHGKGSEPAALLIQK